VIEKMQNESDSDTTKATESRLKPGTRMKPKIVHMASKVNSDGGVSALCYRMPHVIDLSRAMWSLRADAVTCPKCRALMDGARA